MRNEANKSQYVYQPPVKSPEPNAVISPPKKVEEKPSQKIINAPKQEPIVVLPVKK